MKKQGTETETMTEVKTYTVEAPIFILFAEFLGYVSVFNDLAEKWCDGKIPEEYIQKLLMVEAKSIFRQMKKDYSEEDIREFYEMYYPLVFEEYEEKLKDLLKKANS